MNTSMFQYLDPWVKVTENVLLSFDLKARGFFDSQTKQGQETEEERDKDRNHMRLRVCIHVCRPSTHLRK